MATPTIPITDPQFQYVPADKTDIRETFKRVLAQQQSINKNVFTIHTIKKQK